MFGKDENNIYIEFSEITLRTCRMSVNGDIMYTLEN